MVTTLKQIVLFSWIIILGSGPLAAQKKWDLKECIEYAKEKSIQVQKTQLTIKNSEVNLAQSKANLLPTVNGIVSQTFSDSKQPDLQGIYQKSDVFSGDYGINVNMMIFQANSRNNTIKKLDLTREMHIYNLEDVKNTIELAITQAYFQILFAKEMIKTNQDIVSSSEAQLTQSEILYNSGSISKSDYAQIAAQLSNDKYNLVLAQNSLADYVLQLKQLLELPMYDSIDVQDPIIEEEDILTFLPDKFDVYNAALQVMPQIKSSRTHQEIAEMGIAISKASYYPYLSFNGSIGTRNLYNQTITIPTQWDHNFNLWGKLTLTIPILDNKQAKSSVQISRLNLQAAQLDQLSIEKDLFQTIESLYQNTRAGQQNYRAAKEKYNASKLSYDLVEEQFNLGILNTVQFLNEKNNLSMAIQNFTKAKYSSLLNLKMLNFYKGEEIRL